MGNGVKQMTREAVVGLKAIHTWLCGPTLLASLDELREGVVDGDDATEEVDVVHVVHGGSDVLALKEGDKVKGAMFLCVLVERCLDILDLVKRQKCRVQDLLVHLLR
ncbi:hypothetical protein GUJ93_ZPchr0003g17708 [Zizania palustris]|uniref:Uncharacterized protein n=1 Tax=Zizania palustris TaxID=103762 RepID=A0A8J5S2J5_ZIZPA|nr:hypothetical protein GUJ93_ZPchr0003g17708 [Zizania palustris]